MSKVAAAILLVLVVGALLLKGQTSPPASDNPLAGLNLGDSTQAPAFPGRMIKNLVSLNDGQMKIFDQSSLQNVKYWAFYYSASWCPPCRAFTPQLVQFYKSFKPQHPNFELIFVNDDQSEDDMLAYMKNDAMSWPAVAFSDIQDSGAKKFCGEGIPDLVLVDANGKVLSDSYVGGQYRGPQAVMAEIPQIVR